LNPLPSTKFVDNLHPWVSTKPAAGHLELSISRRGNCWDNAVANLFFSSLKKERIQKRIDKTREMANAGIYEHIEMFYNRIREYSPLSGVSPETFDAVSKRA
jgi:putative transposase